MKKQISKIFSSDGELSKNIKGFKPRAEQLEMAQSGGYAIQNKRPLVVEAGTGTGKTFAYLAPALIAGKKTIISTGSKNLQDQLFSRSSRHKKSLKLFWKNCVIERTIQLFVFGASGSSYCSRCAWG